VKQPGPGGERDRLGEHPRLAFPLVVQVIRRPPTILELIGSLQAGSPPPPLGAEHLASENAGLGQSENAYPKGADDRYDDKQEPPAMPYSQLQSRKHQSVPAQFRLRGSSIAAAPAGASRASASASKAVARPIFRLLGRCCRLVRGGIERSVGAGAGDGSRGRPAAQRALRLDRLGRRLAPLEVPARRAAVSGCRVVTAPRPPPGLQRVADSLPGLEVDWVPERVDRIEREGFAKVCGDPCQESVFQPRRPVALQ
jgi:hypothetical protein